MATILHFISAVFFLTLIGQGNGQCYPLTDLKVFQSKTGGKVGNKEEWKVTIFNDCICTQWNIKLVCNGFQTVKKIDPSMVARAEDDTCRINKKQPLYGFHTFNFTYAWDQIYPFQPIYSEIACS
ncbi:hypothetical protein JCGZ_07133 [Jatropha curcas]|uniref:Uncharacterized protein n=1 Tax=Jatropha curcas TaxID=180498 RepID=A0A067KBN7_JATCU|nr:uncharacterized protein LOC105637607 [Jatropha curcas]KDP33562.1 hypothetical protein JCGZ_07133 [Jatropha curcas]